MKQWILLQAMNNWYRSWWKSHTTAKVTDRQADKSIIEAEVFGSGIKMFLLSQGAWVKVLAPDEFVEEMKLEIEKMQEMYK